MPPPRKQTLWVALSTLLLLLTFGSIHAWSVDLGGTGAHAPVYDRLFDLYWALGTVIAIAIYGWFIHLLLTTDGKEDAESIGQLPIERGDPRKGLAIALVITVFLLFLSDWTFDTIDFFEDHEANTTSDSFTIDVVGHQYFWEFSYPNGVTETSAADKTLKVPVDVPVVLRVSSGDVFHSFALPEHRIKIDSIPGRVNTGWLEANETGIYPIRCFELCGDDHAMMIGHLEVMEKDEFDAWYSGDHGGYVTHEVHA